jgi:hypothetical protein
MRQFHTTDTLSEALREAGFDIRAHDHVVVRESVSLWMKEAPELSDATRQEVCRLVAEAPEEYRQLRRVELRNGEILEDWNFVLILASPNHA